jgi:hypothetical protein
VRACVRDGERHEKKTCSKYSALLAVKLIELRRTITAYICKAG